MGTSLMEPEILGRNIRQILWHTITNKTGKSIFNGAECSRLAILFSHCTLFCGIEVQRKRAIV